MAVLGTGVEERYPLALPEQLPRSARWLGVRGRPVLSPVSMCSWDHGGGDSSCLQGHEAVEGMVGVEERQVGRAKRGRRRC